MISWIIFDAMGVVYEEGDDTNNLLIPFIKKYNSHVTSDFIKEEYLKCSLGAISSNDFFKHTCKCDKDKAIELEKKYLKNYLKLDGNFIRTAKILEKKYKIGMISNDVSEWSKFLRKYFDLDSIFDRCVISGDIGIRKPDKEIYIKFLEETKINAEQCIYIDDREKNLVQPRELGMHVVLLDKEGRNSSKNSYVINSLDYLDELVEKINM